MRQLNILIVEDESIVAMEIASYIKKLEYKLVDICTNAEDAIHAVEKNSVDVILMDIRIKGKMDGVETAALIKKSYPDIQIIFLTAHLDDYNVDRAVKLNPVAYLAKPFNRGELRVFLKIACRKVFKLNSEMQNQKRLITFDDEFSYDPANHTLFCCQEIIQLTKKENTLLELLIENKNNLIDFYTIENSVWPEKETNPNTIRTLIKRLRQKLKHKFIETVSSQGYKLVLDKIDKN